MGRPRHLARADHRHVPRHLGLADARRPARPDRRLRARRSSQFGEPLARLVEFVAVVIEVVIDAGPAAHELPDRPARRASSPTSHAGDRATSSATPSASCMNMLEALKARLHRRSSTTSSTYLLAGARRLAVPRARPARHHAPDRLLARVDPRPRPAGARPHRRARCGRSSASTSAPSASRMIRGALDRLDRRLGLHRGRPGARDRRDLGATSPTSSATSGTPCSAWRQDWIMTHDHRQRGHDQAALDARPHRHHGRRQQLHRVLQRGAVRDRVPARHPRDPQPLRRRRSPQVAAGNIAPGAADARAGPRRRDPGRDRLPRQPGRHRQRPGEDRRDHRRPARADRPGARLAHRAGPPPRAGGAGRATGVGRGGEPAAAARAPADAGDGRDAGRRLASTRRCRHIRVVSRRVHGGRARRTLPDAASRELETSIADRGRPTDVEPPSTRRPRGYRWQADSASVERVPRCRQPSAGNAIAPSESSHGPGARSASGCESHENLTRATPSGVRDAGTASAADARVTYKRRTATGRHPTSGERCTCVARPGADVGHSSSDVARATGVERHRAGPLVERTYDDAPRQEVSRVSSLGAQFDAGSPVTVHRRAAVCAPLRHRGGHRPPDENDRRRTYRTMRVGPARPVVATCGLRSSAAMPQPARASPGCYRAVGVW